ncbi:MAG: GNAT family N-acetyltransferase, partial [Candidatus Obscuribacterales bacterium]|nr:GNAT family N-acetyltransferase [Candidatus Obscuribacterales bacterium]
ANKISNDKSVIQKIVLMNGKVIGSVSKFQMFGKTQICYGIEKAQWGKGITTTVVQQFLALVAERPLYAQVASDNRGSIRVLEKCGFKLVGKETGFANARKMEIEESIFELS